MTDVKVALDASFARVRQRQKDDDGVLEILQVALKGVCHDLTEVAVAAPTLSASVGTAGKAESALPVKTVVAKNRVSNPAASPPSTSPALAPGQQRRARDRPRRTLFCPWRVAQGHFVPRSSGPDGFQQFIRDPLQGAARSRELGGRSRVASGPLDEGSDGDEADLALGPSQSEHVALAPLRGREAEWERRSLHGEAWFRLVRQTASDLTAFSVPWRVGVHTPTQQGNGRSKHIEYEIISQLRNDLHSDSLFVDGKLTHWEVQELDSHLHGSAVTFRPTPRKADAVEPIDPRPLHPAVALVAAAAATAATTTARATTQHGGTVPVLVCSAGTGTFTGSSRG